jgi:hypothetical protein
MRLLRARGAAVGPLRKVEAVKTMSALFSVADQESSMDQVAFGPGAACLLSGAQRGKADDGIWQMLRQLPDPKPSFDGGGRGGITAPKRGSPRPRSPLKRQARSSAPSASPPSPPSCPRRAP